MRAVVEENKYIQIIPETRKELLILKEIWNKYNLKKVGYCIHAGGKTQHAIDNSDFQINIITK